MSLAKKGFSAAGYSYITEIATKILNFLSAFFVISLLTVEEYGIYNLFLSTVLIFSSTSHSVTSSGGGRVGSNLHCGS